VFLALAVGVALGGGPLKGEVDNTLVTQVQTDRQAKLALQSQITALRSSNTFTDDFAETVAPGLIGGTLRGRVVTVVVLPTATQADVSALEDLVGVAGGSVGGTVRIGEQLVDAGEKQLVDQLGNQLESRAPDVDIPPDASPYERIGALVARAIGTDVDAGAAVDGPATSILAGLSTTSLMSAEGRLNRRGSLQLFVTGPGKGTTDQKQGASTIVDTLVEAVDQNTDGVVLAGPVASARTGGQVKAVRDDVKVSRDVSTVDSLGRTAGQVVTIMALAGQAAGRTGQYGAVDAADGAMPGARSATG
jgi:hypothetical protein